MTVVIPLYKGSSHIKPLWNSLIPHLISLPVTNIEILFVDDGSPDDAVDQLLALRRSVPKGLVVRIIRLAVNAGQQAAVYCGLEHAEGERVLTMDDDLEHPPSFIEEFLEQSEGFDLSYALPQLDKRTGALKLGSRMRDLFFRKILGCPRDITPGSFRVISRQAVDAIIGRNGSFVYVSALLLRSLPNMRIQNLYYSRLPERGTGQQQSRFTTGGRIRLYLGLTLHYGLLFGIPPHLRSRKKAYIIKDEL
nr:MULTISPECIES: glycosyltransferase [unclassified Oceanispirochaeta]